MAVIQDEQGNNKPIMTDTSHVFDVNGNPLHGELFIGETIASDDVEEIDGFAHESDVDALSQSLTHTLFTKTYTNTSQTWSTILNDFYNEISETFNNLSIERKFNAIICIDNQVYIVDSYDATNINCFRGALETSTAIRISSLFLRATNSYYNTTLNTKTSTDNMSATAIGNTVVIRLIA
jgi:hypothetical protein